MQKETRFTDFLSKEHVLADLKVADQAEAVSTLVELLHSHEGGFDRTAAVQAVLEREALAPTVIAPGLALPHARLEGLNHTRVALATLPGGLIFSEESEDPVHVLVLVLTPRSDPQAYLRVVSCISKTLGDSDLLKRLGEAKDPAKAFQLLAGGVCDLPTILTARDIMDPHPITLAEGDTLAHTIQTFCTNRISDLPVVDEEGDLRGMVHLEDLLRLSLPDHLLWMEDLSPIMNFQPFTELLRKDQETRVADFMRERYVSIHPDTPAIQLAKLFLMHEARQIVVLDNKTLLGTVNLSTFIAKLFWA